MAAMFARGLIGLGIGLGCLFGVLLPNAPAAAQEASAAPFLRIETGRHTARINRLASDASGRLVATASHDKTLRLWASKTGAPVATLRVPIEDGEEGSLYAVALSADGRMAIAAGNTGASWDGQVSLYLFDVEKQQLRARLPGQPRVVNHLAFSPDGRFVAGVFGGGAGLRVWDAKSFQLIAEETGYGVRATWVAFDSAGRLATVAADGMVRLYGADFKPLLRQKAPGGNGAYSLAFSPNGELLAVGYADKARVDVLSAIDLQPRGAPSVAGLADGGLAAVAWIGMGRAVQLVAAGTATAGGTEHVVRRWVDQGRGASSDTPISRDSVNQLLPTPDGEILFASSDPAWGLIGADGQVVHRQGGEIGDFRNIGAGRFAVSADGMIVDFGMDTDGRAPFRFDVTNRQFTVDPPPDPGMAPPLTDAPAIKVTNWRNTQIPKLNGVPLRLDDGEWSRSLAFTADRKAFLLGGEFSLRLFDASSGRELRRVSVPATVWGVAAAAGGRVAVAALGDGTIRWYSLDSRKPLQELGALFPHRNGRHWVLWTPEAFFDHSESGGQNLVGIHLNDGKKKPPIWMEFSQVYRVLHAPELVRGKLDGTGQAAIDARLAAVGDLRRLTLRRPQILLSEYCMIAEETRAFARIPTEQVADQPVLQSNCRPIEASALSRAFNTVRATPDDDGGERTTVTLPAGTAAVTLRFRVTDAGDGVGSIHIYRNERNVSAEGVSRGFARVAELAPTVPASGSTLHERVVALDSGTNRVQIRAYNGTEAVYAQSVLLDFVVPEKTRGVDVPAPMAVPPRLLFLAAGINDYKAPGARLAFARTDALALAQTLKAHLPQTYDVVGSLAASHELYDAQATRPALVEALEAIGRDSREGDTVVIYLAGHGIVVPSVKDPSVSFYHFVTQEVPSLDAVAEQALSEKDLIRLVSGITARNVLLFLDTCHAGAFSEGNVDKFYQELGRGRYVLAASASGQEALDGYDGHNGVFARAVLDGLSGRARFADDTVIYHLALGDYVRRRVPRLASEKRWKQDAFFKTGGSELTAFPLAHVE